MKLHFITQEPWHIPKMWENLFSSAHMEDMLQCFHKFEGTHFYMLDFFREEIFLDSPSSPILCGHPKALAEREGFNFFERIQEHNKLALAIYRQVEFFNIISRYPEHKRKNLILHYDVVVEHVTAGKLILSHKASCFKSDKNGNIWLVLNSCSISPSRVASKKAIVVNAETGERHDFVSKTFILSDTKVLNQEELAMLKLRIEGLNTKQMCEEMRISESTLTRLKRSVHAKLDVRNTAGAVHKAHLLGIL
jgi:DNA-binding CsgD family transcriptional regulator